jgi:flagellar hook-basal body complex protein FliE
MKDNKPIDISKTVSEQISKIIKTQKDNDDLANQLIKDSEKHLDQIRKENDIFKNR